MNIAAADDGETASIIMSLRQKLKVQTDEVMQLQSKLTKASEEGKTEVSLHLNPLELQTERAGTDVLA